MVICCLGWFSSSLHVVGVGKAPPSHVLSEGGDRGVVGRRKEDTPPTCVLSEGGVWRWHWSGQGVFNMKKAPNKLNKQKPLVEMSKTRKKKKSTFGPVFLIATQLIPPHHFKT